MEHLSAVVHSTLRRTAALQHLRTLSRHLDSGIPYQRGALQPKCLRQDLGLSQRRNFGTVLVTSSGYTENTSIRFQNSFWDLSLHSRNFQTASCVRCKENSSKESSSKETVAETGTQTPSSSGDFQNIYTFRYIVHTRVLSRFKIYQTLATVAAMPPAVYLNDAGVLPLFDVVTFFGIASVATLMLYVMSNYFRHIVGIISFNEKENLVRISHLTFWGQRRNLTFNLSEIVPLSDMSVKANDAYREIRFYERPVKFYWFHRHGKNTDQALLEALFGKL